MIIALRLAADDPRDAYPPAVASREILVAPSSLAATLCASRTARECRTQVGEAAVGLVLADEQLIAPDKCRLLVTTTAQLLAALLGANAHLAIDDGPVVIHAPLIDRDEAFIQLLPLLERFRVRVNPRLSLRLGSLTLDSLLIASHQSDPDDCDTSAAPPPPPPHEEPITQLQQAHPVLDRQGDSKSAQPCPPVASFLQNSDEADCVDHYIHDRRLRNRNGPPVASRPKTRRTVLQPQISDDEIAALVRRLRTRKLNSQCCWSSKRTQVEYVGEARRVRLFFKRSARSESLLNALLKFVIELLESREFQSHREAMVLCQSPGEAEALAERLKVYSGELEGRQLMVSCVTEEHSVDAQLSFFLSYRRRELRRQICVSTHSLLDEVPFEFPLNPTLVIDGGVSALLIPWLWNPAVQHSLPTRISDEVLLLRLSAAARRGYTVDYVICCEEREIESRPLPLQSTLADQLFLPHLLISLIQEQAVSQWLISPLAPSLGQTLCFLKRLHCIDEELPTNVNETRCLELLKWLSLCEGDVRLAALLLLSRTPKYNCFVEAVSVCAMLLRCPEPFNKRIPPQRLRLFKLCFAVQEGDFLSLANIMFEVNVHDERWASRRGVRYHDVRRATIFADKLVASAPPVIAAASGAGLSACVTEAMLENMLLKHGDNDYRSVDKRSFPGMSGGVRRANEVEYHLVSDSCLHLRPSLPDVVVFWKGLADGRVLARDVLKQRRGGGVRDAERWPVFVRVCGAVDLSSAVFSRDLIRS